MKKKFPYSIKKSLTRILPLGALMAIATHCTKEPQPNPTPAPNPHATKVDTIVWDWDADIGWAPPMDSVKYYTDQDSVRTLYIHIVGNRGPGFPVNCTGMYSWGVHMVRDSLQSRINIDENKVRLAGDIDVNRDNLPNHDVGQEPGMAWYDRDWFIEHGCNVFARNK